METPVPLNIEEICKMLKILILVLCLSLSPVAASAQHSIPQDLAEFYGSFDYDASGSLSIEEAQTFYYWVQDNIQYRYDDENDPDGLDDLDWGDITLDQLGDNRPGIDHSQTPYETYIEGMGDCEDTAIFSTAFYTYHGIESYVAEIDTDITDDIYVDHAACIALLPGIQDTDFDYVEFGEDKFTIIDNAYSDRFGCIDDGDTYQLIDIHTVEAELRLNSIREDVESESVEIPGFSILTAVIIIIYYMLCKK